MTAEGSVKDEALTALFMPAGELRGVTPQMKRLLEKLELHNVRDLAWHLPVGAVDRRPMPPLHSAPESKTGTVLVTVARHMPPPPRSRRPYKILMENESGTLTLVFFNAKRPWLEEQLPVGEQRVISGTFERYEGHTQMTHPDIIAPAGQLEEIRRLEPVYPLTAGLHPRALLRAVRAALRHLPDLPEWDDPHFLEQQGWPDWKTALLALHHIEEAGEEPDARQAAQARMAYDELLANQLALLLLRQKLQRRRAPPLLSTGALREKLLEALPFRLTAGQQQVLREIDEDLAAPHCMLRMLQGDVGSGKTVLALLAMLAAVENGKQAALMAPTGILAQQHMEWIGGWGLKLGFRTECLTGADSGALRRDKLAKIASGMVNIVIGTHALFQESVAFRDLGLVVIDEQHRFGVRQRVTLAEKGGSAHVLLMTATPIPRTLTMSLFGDMAASRLTEKPPGRKPVTTRALPLSRLEEVVESLRRAIGEGNRVYWICPLVEESETSDLTAAESRYTELKAVLGEGRVALLHGRMKPEEKDRVMREFAEGKRDVLVATTVVEVGVNVPEATIMVIEHAERFGLPQLHQLRGRVGRGEKPSSCLLLYGGPLSVAGKARLSIMRETEDGFRIAEEDLRLRGGGEILGTKQSGLPPFRFADLSTHYELLKAARDDIRLVLHHDPDLEGERGHALRILLRLFSYDKAIPLIRA